MQRYYPWLVAGLISLLGIGQAAFRVQDAVSLDNYIFEFGAALAITLFSCMGALIVIRGEGNWVGWLMMAGAFIFIDPFSFLVSFISQPPNKMSVGIWLLLWIHNWFFMLAVLAIIQLVLRFPDGQPPSSRWNWINTLTIVTLLLIMLVTMFLDQFGPNIGTWSVDNPLGFLPNPVFQALNFITGTAALILAVGSLASLFFRYKQGSFLEREQIKWLFFAGAVFIFAVVLLLSYWSTSPSSTDFAWQDFFFLISVLAFPLAIANAILRYRLYDIDILIRRTLQYGLLTGLLVLLYFGGIITLQGIFASLTGEQNSPLVTVITTLGIAAVFNPLRRRVQEFIDRRFYRKKYDAANALNRFAAAVRDDVDFSRISGAIFEIIEETIQPETASVWFNRDTRQK